MKTRRTALNRYVLLAALVAICACSDQGPRLDYQNFGGCANVFVYATTADRREALLVKADRQTVSISTRDTTFDLASPPVGLEVTLELFSRAPSLTPYCSDVLDGSAPAPTVWHAVAGRVSAQIDSTRASSSLYDVTVRVEDAVFQDPRGHRVSQRAPVVIKAMVGWYAG